MQAIILAAGMGRRLKGLTAHNTKCMIKVNGVTLIERMLGQIEKQNVSRIVVVVGYKGEKLKNFIGSLNVNVPIEYVENPVYDKTNNIYSLFLARDKMKQDDTLLFESDIIFEDEILEDLVNDRRENLALVDKYESWMDGTCLKLSPDDSIADFVPGKRLDFKDIKNYYKTINIYKFSKEFATNYYIPFLEAYQSALGQNEYYEQVLRVITMLDKPVIRAKRISRGQRWYEIDDIQDLDIAESIFIPNENKKVLLMQGRYGGYWRYPRLLDFSYLVNPYFPPDRLKDEMKANFDKLLTQYPSGLRVNSLLAAKNFGVSIDDIVVGNGASELIKALLEEFAGKTGFVIPTFDEYRNRYSKELSVEYTPDNPDYSYTVDDLISFFDDKEIKNMILINPDNPSGNYIPKKEMLRFVEWTESKGIRLVVDESFVDFADEPNSTLIDQRILNKYGNLFVMKSISKSYGVPGLRLGVLASGDKEAISKVKSAVAIWNINSFAEFFMQIEEKYQADYRKALVRFREERKRFEDELDKIEGIRIIPSQANYVMIKVKNGKFAGDLLKRLLIKHDMLIKDLTLKTKSSGYMRIAIRDTHDNDALLKALEEEVSYMNNNA
ncbi:aminotransferase class I/II-fold pyridoxal phosphate-dependent enzyme [Butyrivibrio sp. XPD2006]|uniref:aminotransferase class I/II-fold pyridoxal phosphate-dependent enzyme n=1 Tax=Butyrivibrio sp. XPD2006 TaxID=1280668 RepID=UPI0003B7B55F|nr:aminotransferase class I/II-fold pyridoxal phosphate-dependent enzyme [Butyrivibrio sp. XPD2006]